MPLSPDVVGGSNCVADCSVADDYLWNFTFVRRTTPVPPEGGSWPKAEVGEQAAYCSKADFPSIGDGHGVGVAPPYPDTMPDQSGPAVTGRDSAYSLPGDTRSARRPPGTTGRAHGRLDEGES